MIQTCPLPVMQSASKNADFEEDRTLPKSDSSEHFGINASRIVELAHSAISACHENIHSIQKVCSTIIHEFFLPQTTQNPGEYRENLDGVMCKRITPAPEIGRPTNKIAFPDSPELTICLDWISRALLSPSRYQLESALQDPENQSSTHQSLLSLRDRLTKEISTIAIPFSLDIVYQNDRIIHCILISKLCYGQGCLSSPPICWDALGEQSLVLKTQRITEVARPIIEHIAKERFSAAVPMLVLKEPYWRVYELDCGKDLLHLLMQHQLNSELKLRLAKDLLQMLSQFHSKTYLIDNQRIPAFHGDLKPSNILCNNEFLLTDFGFTSPATIAGTFGYMAPEVVRLYEAFMQKTVDVIDQEFNQYRQAQDIWSMGITLFQLLKGPYEGLPFSCKSEEFMSMSQEAVDEELAKAKPPFLPQELESVWTCIEKMLRIDPKERISAKQAHKFLQDRIKGLRL